MHHTPVQNITSIDASIEVDNQIDVTAVNEDSEATQKKNVGSTDDKLNTPKFS